MGRRVREVLCAGRRTRRFALRGGEANTTVRRYAVEFGARGGRPQGLPLQRRGDAEVASVVGLASMGRRVREVLCAGRRTNSSRYGEGRRTRRFAATQRANTTVRRTQRANTTVRRYAEGERLGRSGAASLGGFFPFVRFARFVVPLPLVRAAWLDGYRCYNSPL